MTIRIPKYNTETKTEGKDMKRNNIYSLILLVITLFAYGCASGGPVVYYEESNYRGKSTFTFTPSFGNPSFKEGWNAEKKSFKDDNFRREERYAFDLGSWEAKKNIPYRPFLGWRHFGAYEDGYKRNQGRYSTSTGQLERLKEEKGELDEMATIYGYPKRLYKDLVNDPYYQRGRSDYRIDYERDNKSKEETHNYRSAEWIADMHRWERDKNPQIDSSREYKRLMYNLGVLSFQAEKNGYPQIDYPSKKK